MHETDDRRSGSNQVNGYDYYGSYNEGDRSNATDSYPRPSNGKEWTTGKEPSNGSSSTYWKTNTSERGLMSSSPEATRDEDGSSSKKKRRIQQACKACSLRRVKCNGERPCQTCVKNEDECVYGQPKKRGPAKGTTRAIRKDQPSTPSSSLGSKVSQSGHPDSRSQYQPHSPTSFNPATSLLALQNSQSHLSSKGSSGIHDIAGTNSQSREESRHNSLKQDPSFQRNITPSEDQNWSQYGNVSERVNSRSVYLGSTSGLATPTQRPRFPNEQMPSPSLSGYNAPRPEHDGSVLSSAATKGNRQYDYQSAGSSLQYSTPQGQYSQDSLSPHQRPPAVPSSSKIKSRPLHHLDGGEGAVDELEVAEASLEEIFHEIHESKNRPEKSGIGSTSNNRRPSNPFRITLQYPRISQEEKLNLFHIFWSGISLHWPLFYRKSYNEEMATLKKIDEDHPLLFNAICSMAALLRSESDASELASQEVSMSHRQLSTVFYARARYYNIRASQNPCLESAAALILLSLRESGAGHSTEASQYCWSACRMALDLGLHRHGELSQSSDKPFSHGEDENRRRVFWCAYVLDKTLAAQFGRPPILRSAESDCPLPSIHTEDDEWMTWEKLQIHPGQNVSSQSSLHGRRIGVSSYFINGCKLAVICEAIIERYNVVHNKQEVWQRDQGNQVSNLHSRLVAWMEATPDHLKWSSNESAGYLPSVLHQQVWSQICMILIHRPFILKGCGDPRINSHAECSKATETLCGLYRNWERLYDIRGLPSGSVYCLFTAATIALANTTSTEQEVAVTARDQLIQCTRWLKILSRTWTSASDQIAILQRLAAGIDPGLAYQTIVASNEAIDATGRPSSPPKLSLSSSTHLASLAPLDQDSSRWCNPEPTAAHFTMPTIQGGSIPMNNVEEPPRYDFGLAQLQSVDAFWNDMPLGENFQRWDQFTQAYFKTSANVGGPPDVVQTVNPIVDGGGAMMMKNNGGTNIDAAAHHFPPSF